jgi:hypothetical protein
MRKAKSERECAGRFLGQIENQELGAVGTRGDGQLRVILDGKAVTRARGLSVHLGSPKHHLHPGPAPPRQGMRERLAVPEPGVVEPHVLMNEDRAIAPVGRADEPQAATLIGGPGNAF